MREANWYGWGVLLLLALTGCQSPSLPPAATAPGSDLAELARRPDAVGAAARGTLDARRDLAAGRWQRYLMGSGSPAFLLHYENILRVRHGVPLQHFRQYDHPKESREADDDLEPVYLTAYTAAVDRALETRLGHPALETIRTECGYAPPSPRPRYIYLLDASGSTIDTLPFVVHELMRSLNVLKPEEGFAVICFNGDGLLEPGSPGIRAASQEAKSEVIRWLRTVASHGSGDVMAALERAFSDQPQIIYLCSDGLSGPSSRAAEREALLSAIARWQQQHPTRIYCIDVVRQGRDGLMQEIAEKNGGIYRFADRRELGLDSAP